MNNRPLTVIQVNLLLVPFGEVTEGQNLNYLKKQTSNTHFAFYHNLVNSAKNFFYFLEFLVSFIIIRIIQNDSEQFNSI